MTHRYRATAACQHCDRPIYMSVEQQWLDTQDTSYQCPGTGEDFTGRWHEPRETIYQLNSDGLPSCPHCGSVEWASDTNYIPANEAQEELYTPDDERVYIRSSCRGCGKTWHEEWRMHQIHLTEERP